MSEPRAEPPGPSDPSWWFAEALALEGNPPPAPSLAGRIEADVVIVGGGFAGLWTANALKDQQPDINIALIEADTCGSGASGKNGGMVSGYGARLPALATMFGLDAALHVVRCSTMAQDIIRRFAATNGTNLWFSEGGSLRIATHPSHETTLDTVTADAERLGVSNGLRRLTRDETHAVIDLPLARGGVHYLNSANIHPGRLVRALRRDALRKGVKLFEKTALTRLDRGTPCRIMTANGEVIARDVVLTMNTGLTIFPELRRHISLLSSYVLMTEPVPERVAAMNWTGQEGLTDMYPFLRYARKTPDHRVLVGWTGGPIAYGSNYRAPQLRESAAGAAALIAGMNELLPALRGAPIAKVWGGGVDVSSDRLPFFCTLPCGNVHVAGGFSGHGVNATCIAGHTLASLVLRRTDEWTTSALVTRKLKALPPEPLRYLGARAIRWGTMNCQKAMASGATPGLTARGLAALPELLGLKLGTR
jgi:glycine/D-amino acid oxidase-like deaminating enzyme